jgi:hypothetical protein
MGRTAVDLFRAAGAIAVSGRRLVLEDDVDEESQHSLAVLLEARREYRGSLR